MDNFTYIAHVSICCSTRMPFRFQTAHSTIQRTIDTILFGVPCGTGFVYINDVVLFSMNNHQHVKDTNGVLMLHLQAGVPIKPLMYHFSRGNLNMLAINLYLVD